MRVLQAYSFQLISHADQLFICKIAVEPRAINCCRHLRNSHLTPHWLHYEQWMGFEKGLHRLLDRWDDDCGTEQVFFINPLVRVSVKRSQISRKKMCDCINYPTIDKNNIIAVLDCHIEYWANGKWKLSESDDLNANTRKTKEDEEYIPLPLISSRPRRGTTDQGKHEKHAPETRNDLADLTEYIPQLINSQPRQSDEYEPTAVQSSGTFTPYTPSFKDSSFSSTNNTEEQAKGIHEDSEVINSSPDRQQSRSASRKLKQKSAIREKEPQRPESKKRRTEQAESTENVEPIEEKIEKSESVRKNSDTHRNEDDNTLVRRSERSPVKPLKFAAYDEVGGSQTKRKTNGSDSRQAKVKDSVPDSRQPKATPSKSKRHRADQSGSIEKYLSTPKQTPTSVAPKKKLTGPTTKPPKSANTNRTTEKSPSTSPISHQYCQTREAMEEAEQRLKYHQELRPLLEQWNGKPVPKVDTLNLMSMSREDILNTFQRYKSKLDVMFDKLKYKHAIASYNGISHYTVMDLTEPRIQQDMMLFLTDEYVNLQDNVTGKTQLITNVMMPHWIVYIFMDKYDFKHDEAIKHIDAQKAYIMDRDDSHAEDAFCLN